MTGSPEPADPAPELFDFVALYLADRDAGVVRPLDEYQARFPAHAAAVAAEFARLTADAAPAPLAPRQFGPYRLLEPLGSGGQGTVVLAEDTRLQRKVALKLLAPHLHFVSTERLLRFRREAAILAQLDHPGIGSVFEADAVEGVPYLAMRLVEGRTLATLLEEQRARHQLPRTRAELHRVLRWIEAAARALHEAHEAGVVHRDIKPGNLMITPQDQPVLLDFGLARQERYGEAVTQPGAVMGTLDYMAPELLDARAAHADRRVDVYALGVTLYECLTLRRPFAASSPAALCQAIQSEPPADLRARQPALPRELIAVVETAMARAPGDRYATALELAEDLARVQARQPIHARPVPAWLRAARRIQRHPTLSLGVAALAVLAVVLAVLLQRVSRSAATASALYRALQAASTDEGAAEALAELVAAAGTEPDAGLQSAILQVLERCHLAYRLRRAPQLNRTEAQPAVDPDGRFVALGDLDGGIALYDAATGQELRRTRAHQGQVHALVFRDGQRLWSAGEDGALCAWSVPELRPETRLLPRPAPTGSGAPRPVHALCLSPDRQLLAVGGQGFVSLCVADDGRELRPVLLPDAQAATRLLFAPRGDQLLVLGRQDSQDPDSCDQCCIVAVADGARQYQRTAGQELVWAQWHPTQPALLLAGNLGQVQVLDTRTWAPCFQRDVGQQLHWCGFDPSGELLLLPQDRGTGLWRWATPAALPERTLPHGHMRTVGAAAWSPDQRHLAAVHRDGTVVVYATADWRVVQTFRQRMLAVRFLCWRGGDAMLLTADLHQLSAWHAAVRPHLPGLWGPPAAATSVALRPDGQGLATGSQDGTLRCWSLARGAPVWQRRHGADAAPPPLRRVRFDAAGRRLLSVAEDPTVRVWDAATGAPLWALAGTTAPRTDAWFGPDDNTLVDIGSDGQTLVWDLGTGSLRHTLRGGAAPALCVAFHPQRPWLAVGSADRHVRVWDLRTGAAVQDLVASTLQGDWRSNPLHQVRGLCFDPQRNRLLASLVNNFVVAWDLADWHEARVETDRFGGELAFDPLTQAVVCADFSFGRLSRLDGMSVTPLLADAQVPHTNRIAALRLHPRGGQALSAGHDGQVWLWDLAQARPLLGVRSPGAVLDADWSADGRWFATAAVDGTVQLWPTDPVAAAREYLARRREGR